MKPKYKTKNQTKRVKKSVLRRILRKNEKKAAVQEIRETEHMSEFVIRELARMDRHSEGRD